MEQAILAELGLGCTHISRPHRMHFATEMACHNGFAASVPMCFLCQLPLWQTTTKRSVSRIVCDGTTGHARPSLLLHIRSDTGIRLMP